MKEIQTGSGFRQCSRTVPVGEVNLLPQQRQRCLEFEQVGSYNEEFAVGFNDADFCLRVWEAGFRTIFSPYAELYHYEFTSRGREEANEEKLRSWKREQALFTQRWPEFFLNGDPWLGPNLSSGSLLFSLLSEVIPRFGIGCSRAVKALGFGFIAGV